MKIQADKKRTEIEFKVGDWVLVQLKPYRQQSVANRMHHKFCKRYFGPYKIERKVNEVAYGLQLQRTVKSILPFMFPN